MACGRYRVAVTVRPGVPQTKNRIRRRWRPKTPLNLRRLPRRVRSPAGVGIPYSRSVVSREERPPVRNSGGTIRSTGGSQGIERCTRCADVFFVGGAGQLATRAMPPDRTKGSGSARIREENIMLWQVWFALRPSAPRLYDAAGVLWGRGSKGKVRFGWAAVIAPAAASGNFRFNRVRGRLTANPSQLAGAAPRRGQPRRLAGVHEAVWPGRLRFRAQARPAGRRRGRSDAGRDAFGFQRDRPARLRSQSGNVPRLAVHDHAQQGLQFSLGAPHPPAGLRRHDDESIAGFCSPTRATIPTTGKGNISGGSLRSPWSASRASFKKTPGGPSG